MGRRTWDPETIERYAARRRSGEPWSSICEEAGVHPNTLRTMMYRLQISFKPPPDFPESKILQALLLRRLRNSWPNIAREIGWTGDPNALAQRVKRYTNRHKMRPVPSGHVSAKSIARREK